MGEAVYEVRCRMRLCCCQTAAVERGKQTWRNKGLEGQQGDKSDAIDSSSIALLMDDSGVMTQCDSTIDGVGRRGGGGKKSIVVVDC